MPRTPSPLVLTDQRQVDNLSGGGCAAEFRRAFCARVRAARTASGLTQAEMARVLDIKQSAYEKYEVRTLLPHRLVPRFAAVTGVEFDELFPPPRGNSSAPNGTRLHRKRAAKQALCDWLAFEFALVDPPKGRVIRLPLSLNGRR